MIFIYPAVISKNIDPNKVQAFTKSLEIYFLNQISESISSGVLRVKTKWQKNFLGTFTGRGQYGPLIVENLNYINDHLYLVNEVVDHTMSYEKMNEEMMDLNNKLYNHQKTLTGYQALLTEYEKKIDLYNNLYTERISLEQRIKNSQIQNEIDIFETELRRVEGMLSSIDYSTLDSDYKLAKQNVYMAMDAIKNITDDINILKKHMESRQNLDSVNTQDQKTRQSELDRINVSIDKANQDRLQAEKEQREKEINRRIDYEWDKIKQKQIDNQAELDPRQHELNKNQIEKDIAQLERETKVLWNREDEKWEQEKLQSRQKNRDWEDSKDDRNLKRKLDKQKNERENEKAERDREEEKRRKQAETLGGGSSASYTPAPLTNVDLAPTQTRLDMTEVYKIGGERHGTYERQSVSIGVKVVPFAVKDYDRFINVMMDDYYSRFLMRRVKKLWRGILIRALRVMKKWPKLLLGNYIRDIANPTNPTLYRGILLNDKGLIDASTFTSKVNRAKFHKFSAAIVLMSKEDLFEEDREGFLQRPKQIQNMLSLGWNSMLITDEPNALCYFISFIDGGAVYTLPYSYIFSNFKLDKVYESMDDLKKHSKPFMLKSMDYKMLSRKFIKESETRDYVDMKLLHYSEDL